MARPLEAWRKAEKENVVRQQFQKLAGMAVAILSTFSPASHRAAVILGLVLDPLRSDGKESAACAGFP